MGAWILTVLFFAIICVIAGLAAWVGKGWQRFGCGTLAVICAAEIIVGIAAGPHATDPPRPTGSEIARAQHDQRQIAKTYWDDATTAIAIAASAMQEASRSVDAGDAVTAQQLIKTGQSYLDTAFKDAGNGSMPENSDDWQRIQNDLMSAATTYRDGFEKVANAIDDGSSEEMAEALNGKDETLADIEDAQRRLRAWYVAHGGKASDIQDFPTRAADTVKSTDAIVQTLSQ